MIVQGTHGFRGSPEAVWDLLLDPAVIAKAMPGTRELTLVEPGRYAGTMQISLGPITAARFDLRIGIVEPEPPRRFTMTIDSHGQFGFSNGTARVELTPDGKGTVMTYHADLQVGGKLASLGQRLLDVVSRSLLRSGLDALGQELSRRLEEDRA